MLSLSLSLFFFSLSLSLSVYCEALALHLFICFVLPLLVPTCFGGLHDLQTVAALLNDLFWYISRYRHPRGIGGSRPLSATVIVSMPGRVVLHLRLFEGIDVDKALESQADVSLEMNHRAALA